MSKQTHAISKTKSSGNGKHRIKFRDKRRSEAGSYFSATRMGDVNLVDHKKAKGGNLKIRLKRAAFANVLTKQGYKKAKISAVIDSQANRNFPRQNILTKGAKISTELGDAVVTNRPGREGVVNAKLLQ